MFVKSTAEIKASQFVQNFKADKERYDQYTAWLADIDYTNLFSPPLVLKDKFNKKEAIAK